MLLHPIYGVSLVPDIQPAGNAATQATPVTPRVIRPIYSVLGFIERCAPGYFRFVVAVRGQHRVYRSLDMCSLESLLDIYPDAGYWRALFPIGKGFKIDMKGAASWFVREAQKRGPYIDDGSPLYPYYLKKSAEKAMETKAYT